MLLVVAYDVADDRRRVRLHTMLLGWGTPVQESVFECLVDERQARTLKDRVRRAIRRDQDLVNFYPLCADCAGKAEDASGNRRPLEPAALVV
jgi:CRISPR-associated protein Cas2